MIIKYFIKKEQKNQPYNHRVAGIKPPLNLHWGKALETNIIQWPPNKACGAHANTKATKATTPKKKYLEKENTEGSQLHQAPLPDR